MTETTKAPATAVPEPAAPAGSGWAPLRIAVFRMMWIAALVSNIGSWMHLVAAAWLMTSLTASVAIVALLQSANALPSFLLALPGGAIADVFDRRRLIIITQSWQLVISGILGVLALTGTMTTWLLLLLTVLLSAGATLGLPAYSAITPDLVPPAQVPAAVSLNSVTVTASLAVGPALGGLAVAWLGPGVVFLFNAASFVAVLIAVLRWREPARLSTMPPEHIVSAVRSGVRYTLNAPEFLTVLVRATAYVLAFSAVPALLAVVTRTRLASTAAQYGLLLGIAGLGGVASAFVLPAIRRRVSTDTLVAGATVAYAATLVAVGSSRSLAPLVPFMFLGGFAQLTVLSSLNIAAQQVLPAWVRGRGLAMFMLTFQLGIAGGAAAWGAVATNLGIQPTFLIAATLMIATIGLVPIFRLNAADRLDSRLAYQPEPYAEVNLDPDDGPMLISTQYVVPDERLSAFASAARGLRKVRRREGALNWALFEDVERPGVHIENYLMASWSEHKRQADRRTRQDQDILDRVAAQHEDTVPPQSRYLIGHHYRRHTPR